MLELNTNPAVGGGGTNLMSDNVSSKSSSERQRIYSLGLHQLRTRDVFVSYVGSADTNTVDAPALLCAVALLGLEFAVILAFWVVDPIIVHKGSLDWFPSYAPDREARPGSLHLSLH